MALIERLMGLEEPKIAVHPFFAAAHEIVMGRLTAAQVKGSSFLNLDAAASTEFDTIAATAPTGSTSLALANKSLWVNSIHAIFILAEERAPGL